MCPVCSGSGDLPRAKRLRKDIFGTAAPAAAAAWTNSSSPMVVLFYKYVALSDVAAEISFFGRAARAQHMRGRVLLASEGVNANLVAPSAAHMAEFIKAICARAGFAAIDWKTEVTNASSASTLFGTDLVVKEVGEIVSSGGKMPFKLLAEGHGGTHYTPDEFHAILEADRAAGGGGAEDAATGAKPLVVLDIRNSKEFAVGHFAGAEDPGTKSHAEMAAFLAQRAPALKKSKVLMYCTGGIRCEKASALLKSMGVPDVGQLSGGVVRYLERFGDDGFFRGANFVFDGRAAQRAPASASASASPPATAAASASAFAAAPRASAGREVVGTCGCCGVAEDTQSSDRVCCVCRYTVLACDGCRRERQCVLYCDAHAALRDAYFPFLQGFAPKALAAQRGALVALAQPPHGAFAQTKAKRRTIANHVRRIDARLAALERCVDSASHIGRRAARCRCCGRHVRVPGDASGGAEGDARCSGEAAAAVAAEWCDGQCWGWGRDAHDSWRVDLDADAVRGLITE